MTTIFDPVPLKGPAYHLRESPQEELDLHRARLDKFQGWRREQILAEEEARKTKEPTK